MALRHSYNFRQYFPPVYDTFYLSFHIQALFTATMERDQFASLLWLLNPVNLFLAYYVPKPARPLFAVLQIGLYVSVILLIPPTNPAKDYQFGICKPLHQNYRLYAVGSNENRLPQYSLCSELLHPL